MRVRGSNPERISGARNIHRTANSWVLDIQRE